MENYEEKYKKALERAKDLHDNHPFGMPPTWVTCEQIFPELKESEDEKIRKELLDYLKGFIPHHDTDLVTKSKGWINWLEKQGENIILPKFTFNDVLALQCAMEAAKKVQKDKYLYEQLKSLHDRLHDAYWLENQGEQKLTDKVEPKFKVGDCIRYRGDN